MEKILALPDSHIPFNINLSPVLAFANDFKPDKVILVGDMHDWTSCSAWIADQSRAFDYGTIKESYEQLHGILLDPLQEAVGRRCKKVYLTGNHEFWLEQSAAVNPNGRGFWELRNNIDLKKYNMELIPINIPYRVSDHLYVVHGFYTNDFHAKKTVQVFNKSILYGHIHDVQSHTIVSPLDVKMCNKAASIGCLCTRNPSFLRNRPNKWVNGFNYIYVDEDTGFFNDYQVIITDGGFIANGRKYR